MWDWVGGRTSVLSAVGLLPAALQGLDIDALLAGAAACDDATRRRDDAPEPGGAPGAHVAPRDREGAGRKDMVVLPYKDRLLLFARYLQQLVMESLGKRLDLAGRRVDQGITVYGNKGSTDQHAYVQQLRDGVDNFFVTLHARARGRAARPSRSSPGVTAGDYLHGFLLGTREALSENERESMTLTIPRVDAAQRRRADRPLRARRRALRQPRRHQRLPPAGRRGGEEGGGGGARAAGARARRPLGRGAHGRGELAAAAGAPEAAETVYLLLEHLAANGRAQQVGAGGPARATFARAKRKEAP